MSGRHPPVSELLPHRSPLLLLDELLEADLEHAVTRVTVTRAQPFFADGAVPAVLMMEYMAQCAGVCAGQADRARGRPIQPGLLMSCREITFNVDRLLAGDELRVEARVEWMRNGLAQFQCTVTRRGEELAHGSLSVCQEPPKGAQPR